MKRKMTFLASLLILIFAYSFQSFAQDDQDKKKEMSEQEKVWMEFMTPGEEHKTLLMAEGDWKTTTKYWMDPNAEPQTSEGSATFEAIMGGRYVRGMHEGQAWGMPFKGMSLEGYDKAKEEFFSIWIDNMGTGISKATGKYDKENEKFFYKGVSTDPMNEKDAHFKTISWMEGNDKMVFEMYMVDGTESYKTMEMIYTRKK